MTEPVRVTIRNLWDQVPDVACKGLCQEQCTVIAMSEEELAMVRERIPSFPGATEGMNRVMQVDHYKCPALVLGRCSVYDVRPMVCRMWGSEERLKCGHGCVPVGGHLPARAGMRLMDEIREVGGEMGE